MVQSPNVYSKEIHRTGITLPQLPDELVEVTRQLINDGEGHQWVLGDHLVAVVDELGGFYANLLDERSSTIALRRSRAHIIRQLADRTGADASTLRDRECMARFFPPEIRKDYDVLGWSQLRAIKSAGDQWQDYATWTLDNLPAPVRVIRRRIKNNGHDVPPWVGRWERLQDIARVMQHDETAPRVMRNVGRVVSAISLTR